MTSGWDVYYVVFLSALLALAFPAFLGLVSRVVSGRRTSRVHGDLEPKFPGDTDLTSVGRKVNTRFFLGTNAALALITLMLVLIPCVATIRPSAGGDSETNGLAALGIVTLAGLSALGLFYSARKGDLDWLRSFRSGQQTDERSDES
jgi:hypothetical protein